MENLDLFTDSSLNINLPIQLSNKAPECFLYDSF